MAVGPRGVADTTASRLNATADPADARPTRVRRDNLPLPRPTVRDVSTPAKWFPERRFSEQIGIRIDTSMTTVAQRCDFLTCPSDRGEMLRGLGPAPANHMSKQEIFLQAEDGIRDLTVTGVQTCALPI